jgi:cell division septal protein FtsQ
METHPHRLRKEAEVFQEARTVEQRRRFFSKLERQRLGASRETLNQTKEALAFLITIVQTAFSIIFVLFTILFGLVLR